MWPGEGVALGGGHSRDGTDERPRYRMRRPFCVKLVGENVLRQRLVVRLTSEEETEVSGTRRVTGTGVE